MIVISSAGNSYWNCDTSSGNDNNAINLEIYNSRGSTPGSADNVICVGSIGSKGLVTASRVDIWALVVDIISAVYDSSTTENSGGYLIVLIPETLHIILLQLVEQVCRLHRVNVFEQEPHLTQAEALQHLKENALAEIGTTELIIHMKH